MPVVFHRLAVQEFVTARRWYRRRSPQAESRFVAAVADALARAETNPLRAPVYRGNQRWQLLRRYPYVIYFEPMGPAMIIVYALAHARRRPGYWVRWITRP